MLQNRPQRPRVYHDKENPQTVKKNAAGASGPTAGKATVVGKNVGKTPRRPPGFLGDKTNKTPHISKKMLGNGKDEFTTPVEKLKFENGNEKDNQTVLNLQEEPEDEETEEQEKEQLQQQQQQQEGPDLDINPPEVEYCPCCANDDNDGHAENALPDFDRPDWAPDYKTWGLRKMIDHMLPAYAYEREDFSEDEVDDDDQESGRKQLPLLDWDDICNINKPQATRVPGSNTAMRARMRI